MSGHDTVRTELEILTTERIDEAYADLDTMGTAQQVALMAQQGAQAAAAVAAAQQQIVEAVDAIVARRARGGRLVYAGAGTAGRMGVLDASEIPPTFGTDPGEVIGIIAGGEQALRDAVEHAEDDPVAGAGAIEAIGLRAEDALIGISASGRTPFVRGALERAQRIGALTVSLACNAGADISRGVDVAIEVEVGPEIVAGSTRLKAGTAQKLVLNALSTLAMVQEGKVLGNLMVDVRVTNAKLGARAERIVMSAAGCDAATAGAALAQAGGSVKLAVLIAATGLDSDQAASALDAAGGRLRTALQRAR